MMPPRLVVKNKVARRRRRWSLGDWCAAGVCGAALVWSVARILGML